MPELKQFIIPLEHRGWRLDQSLSDLFSEYSRARIQSWIKSGAVQIEQQVCKPSLIVSGGEQVRLQIELEPLTLLQPEPISLDIIHDDSHLLVLNKPAGLVVHPGAGNMRGTLLNALLFHYPAVNQLPRAGIVHRLDKDTSGIMMVAKTLHAHSALVAAIQDRRIKREYMAIVNGKVIAGDCIDAPIGRHPRDRVRMAVVPHGKSALTHYRVGERYRAHSLLYVRLQTGRTHQIRVHLSHLGYPIVGDPVYGGRKRRFGGLSDALNECLIAFPRQALHAFVLELDHPVSGERLRFEAPVPQDMCQLIERLRNEKTLQDSGDEYH